MARLALNRLQCRRLDQLAMEEFRLPGVVLMENAGRGVADLIVELRIDGPVAICCGMGNNAGDGFVIARHLALRGYDPRVLLWGDPDELSGDAATNFRVIQRTGTAIETFPTSHFADRWEADRMRIQGQFNQAEWIVDALLGTGARGAPRPPLDRVIELINRATCRKLAVDVPSGLDCDTGIPSAQTVQAEHTCTFVAPKTGFLVPAAEDYVGQIHVLDIGAPREVLDRVLGESG
jgi:NAD(P)H-hydrate epimerase